MLDPASYHHLRLSFEEDRRILLLELSHGKANEVGRAVLGELERLVHEIIETREVTALVTWSRRTTSRGTPIFVSGADVTERVGWSDQDVKQHTRWQRDVLRKLRHAPVFHVAVVNGIALGWGTEYMLTADYRVACDGAIFGLPETGLGIVPGAGGVSELWAHIGVAQALRLGMTGERIGPTEACRIGLVQEHVADLEAGLARALELANLAITRSPTAMAAYKAAVLEAVGRRGQDRQTLEALAYGHCVDAGEAAIGRRHFDAIREGKPVPWPPRRLWEHDPES